MLNIVSFIIGLYFSYLMIEPKGFGGILGTLIVGYILSIVIMFLLVFLISMLNNKN